MTHFEHIVIGFGKAGKTLAGKLSSKGAKVALIEADEKMYGGTCINIGCIPSKCLVTSALNAKMASLKDEFYKNAVEQKSVITTMLRGKNYDKVKGTGVQIYDGKASFVDKNTIKIEGKDSLTITGDKIYINTGATPIIPNIKGVQSRGVYTSSTLMNLEKLPQNLAIIGGGFIALEFATMYANFGSKVCVFQRKEDFLPNEDSDISETISNALKDKGITFNLGVSFDEIKELENGVSLSFSKDGKNEIWQGDAILMATGRKPNTADLACENAGVKLDERGTVVVNERLQSSQPHIFALGDVNGGEQFTYVSLDDFRIIMSNLNGGNYTKNERKALPNSVFIEPSYSSVGLNEKRAKNAGFEIKIAKMPAAAIPKAQVLRQTKGLLKVIINAKNDEILGAMLFCEQSYEMINIIKLAMDNGIKYQALRDQIYTHPTMSECFNDLFDI